ncbi:MAG: ABC transporter permease [Oscillospiraceae bacterium]|nr:ABC transporter permease [Oscillospiraceae bacterium]
MKRFIKDFKKYWRYTKYATKAGLKAEIANSHLSWMWWLLDPICFMIIYTFIAEVVFTHSEPYFPVFVFIGLTIWNFFSKVMTGSVKLVKNQKSVLTRVYLPKWILSVEKMGNLFFKMCISLGLTLILMLIFQVPFSFQLFHLIPVIMVLLVITFGFSTILLHFGVFMEDLSNIVSIFLRLVFYLSGIFYNVYKRVPEPFNKILLRGNPAAFIIEQSRKIILYQEMPDYLWLSIWFGIGLLLSIIGVATIYKYENSYAKVI